VIRLAVRVRREHAELVLAELLELAPSGVEESAPADGVVEYAVYGAPGELPELPDLQAAAGAALVEIATSETADDWHERWKRFHRPIFLEAPARRVEDAAAGVDVPALHVRPPWEPPRAAQGGAAPVEEIVIDPGRAFGTGAHATTRMCLELLLELAAREASRGAVLDVGAGSGVLAIAAARLGFAPVLALDYEEESVQAARENAASNAAGLTAERFDLRAQPLTLQPGSVVLANLLLPLLLDLARSVEGRPSALVASGLLCEQADQAAEAFATQLGLRERRRLEQGEWAALWLS
jgi:ribosomal protein L11 methyltransferase